MPMLNVMPHDLIVDCVPDATPRYFLSTELITALVLGDEKRPAPRPNITRPHTMNPKVVSLVKKMKIKSAVQAKAIQIAAIFRGSNLSESLPANGAIIDMIAG